MNHRKRQRLHLSFFTTVCLVVFTACASPSTRDILDERQSKNNARAAAYAAEGFTMDHRSPEGRPYRAWEFYYKNCSLVSRNPYPNKSEFECADPR